MLISASFVALVYHNIITPFYLLSQPLVVVVRTLLSFMCTGSINSFIRIYFMNNVCKMFLCSAFTCHVA